jgi:uncharacterized membrane protein YfcA
MHSLDIFSVPWILAFCAVLVAAFVRGVSGFGLALILAPILLLLMNSKSTVVVNLLLAIVSNLVVLPLSFRHIYLKGILPMVIFTIPGIVIGAWIITIIEPSTLKIVIGAVIVISVIPLAMGISKAFHKEKLACGFSGFLSGLIGTSTSLGGPPVVLFMHNQNWRKETIHSSLAAYFTFNGVCSVGALVIAGIVEVPTLVTTGSLVPALLIGTVAGTVAFRRLSQRLFRIITLVIIICAGILGILSGTGILS